MAGEGRSGRSTATLILWPIPFAVLGCIGIFGSQSVHMCAILPQRERCYYRNSSSPSGTRRRRWRILRLQMFAQLSLWLTGSRRCLAGSEIVQTEDDGHRNCKDPDLGHSLSCCIEDYIRRIFWSLAQNEFPWPSAASAGADTWPWIRNLSLQRQMYLTKFYGFVIHLQLR